MFDLRFVVGEVVGNHHWTPTLHSLRVKAPVSAFVAGQFVKLSLDIDGKQVARPYSFVNAPHEAEFEFYSVVIPEGDFSPRIQQLKKGDSINVSAKANGFLVLDEVPKGRFLWLIATGTGIGPFLSILKTDTPWERFEQVRLIHGVRFGRELVYTRMIEGLLRKHAGHFKMISFISREQKDFAFAGRIPAAIRNGSLAKKADIPFDEESQVMLCGNPGMVEDASVALQEFGLRKNRRRTPGHITVETYW